MPVDWFKKRGWTRAIVATVIETRVVCNTVNIFPLILFAELNRFHHSKDFTYNYEGETVSSVAGASSARSGLRIRARCVVKAVGPCQHVLKVRQTSYGLRGALISSYMWRLAIFLCLVKYYLV